MGLRPTDGREPSTALRTGPERIHAWAHRDVELSLSRPIPSAVSRGTVAAR